jgi:hypothetical protein
MVAWVPGYGHLVRKLRLRGEKGELRARWRLSSTELWFITVVGALVGIVNKLVIHDPGSALFMPFVLGSFAAFILVRIWQRLGRSAVDRQQEMEMRRRGCFWALVGGVGLGSLSVVVLLILITRSCSSPDPFLVRVISSTEEQICVENVGSGSPLVENGCYRRDEFEGLPTSVAEGMCLKLQQWHPSIHYIGFQSCPGSVQAPEVSTMAAVVKAIAHPIGASDVLIQIGDYHLGDNPDSYVFGPELVIYGDGRVFAELSEGVNNGAAQFKLVEGLLSEDQLQHLLHAASLLPLSPTQGQLPVDAYPTLFVVIGTSWEVVDSAAEPFELFLDELHKVIRSKATSAWVPTRWIVRTPDTGDCTSTVVPATKDYFDAPVYPHLIDRYPLGTFDCYR